MRLHQLLVATIISLIVPVGYAQTGPAGVGDSSANVLWLKAGTDITLNGSTISQWDDQSGNGNHVIQATSGNQPLYVTNELNGHPVARFDGGNDCLSRAGLTLHLESDGEIIVVFKTDTSQSAKYLVSFPEGLLGVNGFDLALETGSIVSNLRTTGLITSQAATSISYDDDIARIARASFAAGLSLGEHRLYIDATLSDQEDNSGPLITNVVQTAFIGCFSESAGNYLEGDIAEVIVYKDALSSAGLNLINTYLSAKFDISISDSKYNSTTHLMDVAGIGREADGSNTEANSAGLVVIDNNALNADGEYLMVGHNEAANSVVTSDLPVGVSKRWNREWYFDKTGTLDGDDVQLAFDFSEGGFSGNPGNASDYTLLRRANTSSQFTEVTTSSKTTDGDRVVFEVADADLTDENYYTVGTTDSDTPLPVQLVAFSANYTSGVVILEWTTASEVQHDAFIIEKSIDNLNFVHLAEVLGSGSTSSYSSYSFRDQQVSHDEVYYYRLISRDFDGTLETLQTLSVSITQEDALVGRDDQIPGQFDLFQNFPNPFNPSTMIRFTLPPSSSESHRIHLKVYDLAGRKIKDLFQGELGSGTYDYFWDGTNESGNRLPAGVYIYELSTGTVKLSRKMILAK